MEDEVIVEPLFCFCVVFQGSSAGSAFAPSERGFGADAVALAEEIWKASERESLEASIEAAFEAIRSRGTDFHVIPSHCGSASATINDSKKVSRQDIELKIEILPVNDLDIALHNFVNKDDKNAFYVCVQSNINETKNKIAKDSNTMKFDDEDLIVKVGKCLEERVKQRSTQSKEPTQFTYADQSMELNPTYHMVLLQ
ncbi:hypothetical protein Ahy_A07g034871 isoform B [Arachis hypogaea]|uniref:Uncharacterized protein n=1 Tax=Arachis hypogaea TaxID=3818 RepID=A0A445CCW7_ARAHY|nr:hypothetical protein Ahy_A07g034871 isoform B [Arachis hypogaea]